MTTNPYQSIILKNDLIQLAISPTYGMAITSLQYNHQEILSTDRNDFFLKNRKGLGPIIGPHFNQKNWQPKIDESLFTQIKGLKEAGINDIFQHGIGRYIPWKYEVKKNTITAQINGDDQMHQISLANLNGFDFSFKLTYELNEKSVLIHFDLEGEQPIQAGIHYYYQLFQRSSATASLLFHQEALSFAFDEQAFDNVFTMEDKTRKTAIYSLQTEKYQLDTIVPINGSPENSFDSFILHSPANTNYACLEPISQHNKEINQKKKFKSTIQLIPNA